MATYDIAFNIAKGRIGELATLPGASDSLVAVPLLAAGIVTPATMRDYTNLGSLLAGASDESPIGRKTLANVTSAVDQANDKWVVDCDDITWSAAAGGPVAALVVCYQGTTGQADGGMLPLFCLDMAVTPNGGDITYAVNAGGLYNAV